MIRGFWEKITSPFYVLAPMADVTDCAFRTIIAEYSRHGKEKGGPHVFWTEFVSADGLASSGRNVLLRDLAFSEGERPIVAQLFTSNPDTMRVAATLVQELGFDGIDINMGCPDRSVEKQGAGAALIKNPKLARAVLRAAKEGAPNLPVSVKTRIGYNTIDYKNWFKEILEEGIPVLTVHLRTRKEMSLVPAHWELMKDIVSFVREKTGDPKNGGTLVIGNGDVAHIDEAKRKVEESGCDGIMLGRAIFGNPWLFDQTIEHMKLPLRERFKVLIKHTYLFREMLGDIKSFSIMKKHYKAYVHGFNGAKELRMKLMEKETPEEIEQEINQFLATFTKTV